MGNDRSGVQVDSVAQLVADGTWSVCISGARCDLLIFHPTAEAESGAASSILTGRNVHWSPISGGSVHASAIAHIGVSRPGRRIGSPPFAH